MPYLRKSQLGADLDAGPTASFRSDESQSVVRALSAALSAKGVSPNSVPSVALVGKSGDPRIDALIHGTKWNSKGADGVTEITYSFPKEGASWGWTYAFTREPNAVGYGFLDDVQKEAFRATLKAWSDVANIRFVEVDEATGKVGDIRVAFSSKAEKGDTVAYAYLPAIALPSSGDIWLGSKRLDYDNIYGAGESGFYALMHELGHALGLKHSFEGLQKLPPELDNVRYTVMSYSFYDKGGMANPASPMLFDIMAIQYLYGANKNSHAGNDNYVFSNHEFRAIWDASGVDTFDCSSHSLNSVINLTPGSFSSIGEETARSIAATNNVAIAYGVVIENAIGGAGNDTITGNAVENMLKGGSGHDSVSGNGGVDFLYGEGGNDILYGGTEGDLLDGGAGNDLLSGDEGNDRLIGDSGNNLLYGGAGNDTCIGGNDNDSAFGSYGNDQMYGGGGHDNFGGGDGTDRVFGGDGNDLLHGDNDTDSVYGDSGNDSVYGDAGNDFLWGGEGKDRLYGGAGNDQIYGDGGDDIIETNGGADTVIGGAGDDYVFLNNLYGEIISFDQALTASKAANGYDVIFGFQANGLDKLNIHNVLSSLGVATAHSLIGDAFRMVKVGVDLWELQIDANQDKIYELKLATVQLTAGIWDQNDFIV